MLPILSMLFLIFTFGGIGFSVFLAEDIKKNEGLKALKKDTSVLKSSILTCAFGILFVGTSLGIKAVKNNVEYIEKTTPVAETYYYTSAPYSSGDGFNKTLIVCKDAKGNKLEFWGQIIKTSSDDSYIVKRTPKASNFQKALVFFSLDDELYLVVNENNLVAVISQKEILEIFE